MSQKLKVYLHHFTEDKRCYADLTAEESHQQVRFIRVYPQEDGSIHVSLPKGMQRWQMDTVPWHYVQKQVSETYNWYIHRKPEETRKGVTETASGGLQITMIHKMDDQYEAEVTIPESGITIKTLTVRHGLGSGIQVYMPGYMGTTWNRPEVSWADVRAAVTEIYRKMEKSEKAAVSKTASNGIQVSLYDSETSRRRADILLPDMHISVQNLTVCPGTGNGVQVYMPGYMGTTWNLTEVSWPDVRAAVTEIYRSLQGSEENTPAQIPSAPKETPEVKADQKAVKDPMRDSFGKIRNAKNKILKFVPHTVLRQVPPEKKINTNIIYELVKGPDSLVTPFHVDLLEWIGKLHYSMDTTLTMIIQGNGIICPEDVRISNDKINKITNLLCSYGLVDVTNFLSLDDQLKPVTDVKSRIYTLTESGFKLLKTLDRISTEFNSYDLIRDGNSVKKYLAANQWLGRWISAYPAEIDGQIETVKTLSYNLENYTAARIYASVRVNDQPLVVEPLRRCEDFEKMEMVEDTLQKFDRLMFLFDHYDNLKERSTSYIFSQRPILTIFCEDDEHILEVADMLKTRTEAHPEQIVWFTTDLRTFNDAYADHRYVTCHDHQIYHINYAGMLGLSDEILSADASETEEQNSL